MNSVNSRSLSVTFAKSKTKEIKTVTNYTFEYNGYTVSAESSQPLRVHLSTPSGIHATGRVLGVPASPDAVRFFDYANSEAFPQDVIDALALGYGRELEKAGWFSKGGVQ